MTRRGRGTATRWRIIKAPRYLLPSVPHLQIRQREGGPHLASSSPPLLDGRIRVTACAVATTSWSYGVEARRVNSRRRRRGGSLIYLAARRRSLGSAWTRSTGSRASPPQSASMPRSLATPPCPICSDKVSKDMLNHITMQHGYLFKNRRRLRRFCVPGSQSLSLLMYQC
ncbi:hypothetical protein ACQ4PT_040319 [Festuca glaucescens]